MFYDLKNNDERYIGFGTVYILQQIYGVYGLLSLEALGNLSQIYLKIY